MELLVSAGGDHFHLLLPILAHSSSFLFCLVLLSGPYAFQLWPSLSFPFVLLSLSLTLSLIYSLFLTGWTGTHLHSRTHDKVLLFTILAFVHGVDHAPFLAASSSSPSPRPEPETSLGFAAGPRCLSFLLGNAFSNALIQSLVSVHAVKISTT